MSNSDTRFHATSCRIRTAPLDCSGRGGRDPSQGTRTRKLTLPLPPGGSEALSGQRTAPVGPTAGCVLSAQPVNPAPRVAQLAEANVVHGGVASAIAMFESGCGPGFV